MNIERGQRNSKRSRRTVGASAEISSTGSVATKRVVVPAGQPTQIETAMIIGFEKIMVRNASDLAVKMAFSDSDPANDFVTIPPNEWIPVWIPISVEGTELKFQRTTGSSVAIEIIGIG